MIFASKLKASFQPITSSSICIIGNTDSLLIEAVFIFWVTPHAALCSLSTGAPTRTGSSAKRNSAPFSSRANWDVIVIQNLWMVANEWNRNSVTEWAGPRRGQGEHVDQRKHVDHQKVLGSGCDVIENSALWLEGSTWNWDDLFSWIKFKLLAISQVETLY